MIILNVIRSASKISTAKIARRKGGKTLCGIKQGNRIHDKSQ
jgi:hypothetical protein